MHSTILSLRGEQESFTCVLWGCGVEFEGSVTQGGDMG